MAYQSLFPSDVQALRLLTSDGVPSAKVDHLGLAFFQLPPMLKPPPQWDKAVPDNGFKADYLQHLAATWNPDGREAAWASRCRQRQEAYLDFLRASGRWAVEAVELRTQTALVVGQGSKNAFEVGMTLHPLYGFPYLPGSSVKGLARAWPERGEGYRPGADLAQLRAGMRLAFGSDPRFGPGAAPSADEEQASPSSDGGAGDGGEDDGFQMGVVRFLDAFPAVFPRLQVDFMTVHHKQYYDQGHAPNDADGPTPIAFLTVAPGTPFVFPLIAPKEHADALADAETWLTEALHLLGAGGKTAAGYGLFADFDDDEPRVAVQLTSKQLPEPPRVEVRPDYGPERFMGTPQRKDESRGQPASVLRAQIAQIRGRKVRVHLAAEGYDRDHLVALQSSGGQRAHPVGTWVLVDVQQVKSNRITQVV
ncbi:MAG: type III-B CRISPR module RAMP protein Cmr6, partial [Bacteroidota bacterium]